MCRNNSLRHEAYLGFYSALTTVIVFPAFIGVELFKSRKHEITKEDWAFLLQVMGCLFVLKSIKNFYIDRTLRKRFRQDFDAELGKVDEIVSDSDNSKPSSIISDETALEFDKLENNSKNEKVLNIGLDLSVSSIRS